MSGIERRPPTGGGSIPPAAASRTDAAPAQTSGPRRTGTSADGPDRRGREPRATSAASTGSIPEPPPEPESGSSLGEATLEKAFERMDALEKQIEKLDPEKPGDQKELMQIQLKLQRIQQVVSLINEIRKARHSMAMAVINNIN
jgi:hypothetical protein